MTVRIYSIAVTILILILNSPGSGTLLADQFSEPAPATITRSTFAPVPLRLPQQTNDKSIESTATSTKTSATPLITVGSSLAIVLGLFAALVWVSRKATKNTSGNRELPDEALRILGKKSLGPSGSIALVRCGRSVLIVGIHSSGMQRLGEISNDDEVRHLEALCNGNSKASFDHTMAEMQREPIKRGFTGDGIEHSPASARHKLFA